MNLTSETFRLAAGGPIFTAVDGFELTRLPIDFGIPHDKCDLLEVWALGERLELLCLVLGWRDLGHYEWLVVREQGLPFEAYSDKGFGFPEAARAEGLAMLRQHLLAWDEEVAPAGKETASNV